MFGNVLLGWGGSLEMGGGLLGVSGFLAGVENFVGCGALIGGVSECIAPMGIKRGNQARRAYRA